MKAFKKALLSALVSPAVIFFAAAFIFGLFRLAGALFLAEHVEMPIEVPGTLSGPGLLLVLQFASIYLWRAFLWTAEPMAKSNLGSIVRLQQCITPAQVFACLNRWRKMLECRWIKEDSVTGPRRPACAI